VEFDTLAGKLPAKVGVSIVGSRPVAYGAWSSGVAWSTIKVPLAVAALRTGSEVSDLVVATITQSDNAAAEQLWALLGDPVDAARQVEAVIREAGDASTVVESRRLRAEYTPFGQTRWSLADQARFAAGLSDVADASPVVELMGELTADHRWGLAAKGFAAKGGWGPGVDGSYLVRQFGIVSDTVGVALAAEVHDGGYEAGVDVVDRLADWLAQQ
jgi:Beta-lactamase enzyme family